MHLSQQGVALIKEFEGFAERPYLCPGGKLTIGYGHVLLDHEVILHNGITREKAHDLLMQDVVYAEGAVKSHCRRQLLQHQFDALVSFVYNVGENAFLHSTMLRLIREGDMKGASRQFSRWVYAGGRKLPGLIRRREAECELFEGRY